LKNKICEFGEESNKIFVLHNFINDKRNNYSFEKGNYVLYFGRLCVQKGIMTLIEACKSLPGIEFIIAGSGELNDEFKGIQNVKYVGFKSGNDLKELVSKALFSIYPSEWYENGPLSVLESQMYGTPVIGAEIGGIPELIENNIDGLLFKPCDVDSLVEKINILYNNPEMIKKFSANCIKKIDNFSIDNYYSKLLKIYNNVIEKHRIMR